MNWLVLLTISCLLALNVTNAQNSTDRSLAFVFDTTDSMYDDYQQLKSHAEDIMTYVLKRNDTDIKHFVFVPFNDPAVGPVCETFDPKVIMNKLNRVQIHGGGDCPEMSITAVIQALKAVKQKSYIYLFTDGSPKDTYMINEALELIQKKQSQVVILSSGQNCRSSDKTYEIIASFSSGHVFDINKKDISKVLAFIKTSMDTEKVNLLSVNIPESIIIPSPQKLNIDESIKNLLISVSGQNLTIDLVNPFGKKMNEATGLITDLDLKNVKIINIVKPIPGEWTLYVTSDSAHTIHACGMSTKNFNFGFSVVKSKNLTQTSPRPIKGVENYVLIEYPDVKEFLSCKIQDLYSDEITESLPILNVKKNMILCGPFMPNNNPFYIQTLVNASDILSFNWQNRIKFTRSLNTIFGMNNNDNYFRRFTKTSIAPDVPYVTTPKKLTTLAGDELHITCHVKSSVPIVITWKANNYPQQTWNFSQSSDIELVIRNVTVQHSGVYTCTAQNIAGISESTTNVSVISKPVIVGGNDNLTVVLNEGDDYSMTCISEGVPKPRMQWIMNGSPITHHNEHVIINDVSRLIIYDATKSDANVYICRALNEAGVTEKYFNVSIKANTIHSMANKLLVVNEHNDIYLECPLPDMNNRWFKDGKNINDLIYKRGDEPHYKQIDRGLKIYQLDVSDSAIYTCANSNESYTFDLKVAFAPFFTKYQPETMMVMKNDSVVFDCTTKGFPKPKVIWKKVDSFVPITQWTLSNMEFTENKQKLKIYAVDWIHNGTYCCIVKNKLGVEKRQFELIVF